MRRFRILFSVCFINVFVLVSCSRYADKVEGTYAGRLTINDSVVSSNANIKISEVSNKIVSVESSFFDTYELEIDKQRYFNSVSYFHQDSSGIYLEIGETATGFFLSFVHLDSLSNSYVFIGESTWN
tara:strand:- start:263 stop:643 length:381 start_codon:yes stop_codon:yes gene_type:complete